MCSSSTRSSSRSMNSVRYVIPCGRNGGNKLVCARDIFQECTAIMCARSHSLPNRSTMLRAPCRETEEVTMKNSIIALGLMIAVAAQAAPPTVEEVGDPDSFGRDVIYLGNAQTSNAALQEDCTPDPMFPPAPNDRCIVLNAQPAATSFNEDGLATLALPADSTKSLVCFALTPNPNFEFFNLTGVTQP